jgi:hypothetical protein
VLAFFKALPPCLVASNRTPGTNAILVGVRGSEVTQAFRRSEAGTLAISADSPEVNATGRLFA